MAITAGQFLLQAGNTLINRIQTGGVTSLGIPNDRVYEVGNYETLTTIRDTADLSFTLESLDSSIGGENLMLGPSGIGDAAFVDLTLCQPLSINGPFRSSQNHFDNIRGVIVPHLALESVAYKFGLKANASQTFTLKGDSIYFIPGNPYQDSVTSDGTTLTYALANTALAYFNSVLDVTQYIVNMDVYNPDGTFQRLFNGVNFDYTDSATSFTFNSSASVPTNGAVIYVQYGSTAAQTLAQIDEASPSINVDPAAVRSRDIDVYIGTTDTPPVFSRWSGVQSFDCTWKVDLDPNAEFGNALNVSSDFVVADVSGTITTKDVSVTELYSKIAQATNVPTNQVAGTLSSTPIPIEIRISNPYDGSPLKTLYVPDARFEPPTMQGKVTAKLETPFKFSSDTGLFYVYPGLRPDDVEESTPTITSISPEFMLLGTTGDVIFTGTGFVDGATATVDDTESFGIVTNSITFNNFTQITVNITVPDDATLGSTGVFMVNPDEGSFELPDCFTVEASTSTPTVTSLDPASMIQDSSANIVITGTEFLPGCTATILGGPITTYFISDTEIEIGQVNVLLSTPPGVSDIVITNPDGGTVSAAFTVVAQSTPVITSISPTSMAQGATGDIVFTGTDFWSGGSAAINLFGGLSGITRNSTTFDSSTQFTVNVTIAGDATLGATDAFVGNPDGGADDLPDAFTVTT